MSETVRLKGEGGMDVGNTANGFRTIFYIGKYPL